MPPWHTIARTLGHCIVRRRGLWVLGTIVAVSAMAVVASGLSLRLDFADFLLESPQAGEPQARMPDTLSPRDRVLVVLNADRPLAPEVAGRILGDLAERLEAGDGISKVGTGFESAEQQFVEDFLPRNVLLYVAPDSLKAIAGRLRASSIRVALADGLSSIESPATYRLADRLKRDPLRLAHVAAGAMQHWQPGSRVRLNGGLYSLPGDSTFFLQLEMMDSGRDLATSRAVVQWIDGVLIEARSDSILGPLLRGSTLYSAGLYVSQASTFTTLYGDIVRVAAGAGVVVFLLLGAFFGSLVAPLSILATVGVGILATAAGATLLLGSVSLMAWIFVALLLGIGVDFGIYVSADYWVFGNSQASVPEALVSAMARPGRGIVVAGLTTAAAFASVGLIPSPVTREIGLLTAFGIVSIFVSSLVVLPLLLSFSAPAARLSGGWVRWTEFWVRRQMGSSVIGLAPWILVLAGGLVVVRALPFEADQGSVIRNDESSVALEQLVADIGVAFPPLVMLSRGATAEVAIERDREAVQRVLDIGLRGGISAVESLSRWLPASDDQLANLAFIQDEPELFSAARFRRDFTAAIADSDSNSYLMQEYLPLVERAMNPASEVITVTGLRRMGLGHIVDRHVAEEEHGFVVASFIYFRKMPWTPGIGDRFIHAAQDAGLYDLPGVSLRDAGFQQRKRHERTLRSSALRATLAALALVVGILAFRFRRLSPVLLCLVPLACALSAAALTMRAIGLGLSLTSITIAPILVGIAVDDGIHMVDRLSDDQGVQGVLREMGASMTMTTLTSVGAFACLGLATFTGIRELGFVGAVGLVVAMVASLHLVPLGWRLIEGHPVPPTS